MITCFPIATLNTFINTGSQLADILNEQTSLEILDAILTLVSAADGQREGEWDSIKRFALFTQSLQKVVIPANALVGKGANLPSCATAAGACCTHSRFRWSQPEQHQIISGINIEIPEGSHRPLTGTLKGEDATSTAPMMHVCRRKLCCTY